MTSLPRLLLSVLLLLTHLAASAHAGSPEETVREYVAAVQEEGISAVVRFTHPDELATFRAGLEPVLAQRVRDARTRQRFASFADPYNLKEIRQFKDDVDFATVFLRWVGTAGLADITTYQDAVVTPLGSVNEGELRHVVARFEFTSGQTKSETVSVTSMKMHGGKPMLLLLPELKFLVVRIMTGR